MEHRPNEPSYPDLYGRISRFTPKTRITNIDNRRFSTKKTGTTDELPINVLSALRTLLRALLT